MNALGGGTWSVDWAWNLPLIARNVVIHVLVLGFATEKADHVISQLASHRRFALIFALVMGITIMVATILHGIEACVWAAAYRLLAGFPGNKLAMLYSLSAMTSYGNSNTSLPKEWQIMSALEALNGMLLFGLSTAFLFAMIQRVRLASRSGAWRLG